LSQAEQASKAKVIDEKKKQLDRDSEDARNDFQAIFRRCTTLWLPRCMT